MTGAFLIRWNSPLLASTAQNLDKRSPPIPISVVADAISRYGLDTERANPFFYKVSPVLR